MRDYFVLDTTTLQECLQLCAQHCSLPTARTLDGYRFAFDKRWSERRNRKSTCILVHIASLTRIRHSSATIARYSPPRTTTEARATLTNRSASCFAVGRPPSAVLISSSKLSNMVRLRCRQL